MDDFISESEESKRKYVDESGAGTNTDSGSSAGGSGEDLIIDRGREKGCFVQL